MEKWGGYGYNHRMKKRRLTIPTYFFLILFVLCIVGLVLGSFFDLKISQAIGDPTGTNVFGAIIETIAIVPAYMLMGFAGCLLGNIIGGVIGSCLVIFIIKLIKK